MVEHPERHWHTGDIDVDESDSNESEREHPDETYVEETDLGKTECEGQDDTDVNESDSGEKDQDEDEDEDQHSTLVPLNEINFKIDKELEHSKRIISETPVEIDLINVQVYSFEYLSVPFFSSLFLRTCLLRLLACKFFMKLVAVFLRSKFE